MVHRDRRLGTWPIAGLACTAAVLGLVAALPETYWAAHLTLVDFDESRHTLPASTIAFMRGAAVAAALTIAALALALLGTRDSWTPRLAAVERDGAVFSRWLARALRRPRRSSWVAGGVALACGVALRVTELGRPIQFDEADTFSHFASRNLFSLVTDYTQPNNHILHSVMVHFSTSWFGSSVEAIRLPALAAGLAVVAATFWAGRLLAGESAGLAAACLAAGATPLVEYSVNARGYSLVALFFLLSFLPASYLAQRRSAWAWVSLVGMFVLGLFTVPVMLYPIAAVSAWMLTAAERTRRGRLAVELCAAGATTAVLTVALYLPAAMRSGWEKIVANRWVRSLSWEQWRDGLPELPVELLTEWTRWIPTPVLMLFAIGLIASLWRQPVRRLLVACLVPVLTLMALQRVLPFVRVFVFLAPIAAIAAGAGWVQILEGRLVRRWLGGKTRGPGAGWAVAVLGGTAVIAMSWAQWVGRAAEPSEDMRIAVETQQAAETIAARFRAGDGVLADFPHSEPVRYILRADPALVETMRAGGVFPAVDADVRRLSRAKRLWIMRPTGAASDRGLERSARGAGFEHVGTELSLPLVEVLAAERGDAENLVAEP